MFKVGRILYICTRIYTRNVRQFVYLYDSITVPGRWKIRKLRIYVAGGIILVLFRNGVILAQKEGEFAGPSVVFSFVYTHSLPCDGNQRARGGPTYGFIGQTHKRGPLGTKREHVRTRGLLVCVTWSPF